MDLGIITLLFVIGAAIGSFVNVIAIRYNTGLSFIKGNSVCLSCSKKLEWQELIPVLSYIGLKGRCSGCGARFSIQYLLVEIVSGLSLIFLYLAPRTSHLEVFILFSIFETLVLIFIYDLRHKIIPDSFVFSFVFLSFLYSYFVARTSILGLFLPAILIPLPFFLIWFFSKGRLMGLGDPKLMVGIGVLLGLERGIGAIFLSFWFGTGFVLVWYLYKKSFGKGYNVTMKSELPFAPFLITGLLIQLFFDIDVLNLNVF